ncbi:hypothetical protein MKW94_017610 [Papaver nudicaule]|uniref:Uncharacterized protein n=1 Tax=Papaver nudicaule TaxID=74823 RepID=A0AA41VBZ4_PAPNU|nr:hypothetical protein [Papaver nudicaule]MCL7045422.1 hypothetical protein [Papaver nudicaule]
MAKISSSSILFLVGFLLLLITVSAATGKTAPAPSGTAPDGSECPMRDAANSNGTSRVVDGLSCDGCMRLCFKKCGKSKSKTGLACRQMTVTKWSCGCCCSKD